MHVWNLFGLCRVARKVKHGQTKEHGQSHWVAAQNIAFCISNRIRPVDCPRTLFSYRAASAITERGKRWDGQEYSSRNFLIKEPSTIAPCGCPLDWKAHFHKNAALLLVLISAPPPPFPISARWENKVTSPSACGLHHHHLGGIRVAFSVWA